MYAAVASAASGPYIRRLVASGDGDARKVPNPADGRSYHFVLTAKGQRVVDRGWPAVVAAFERVERHLERPAGDHLQALLELREAVRLALAEATQATSSTR
jgi:hypothetical protein